MYNLKVKALLVAGASLLVSAPALAVPITSGHVDLDIDYNGTALSLDWKTYNPMSAGTPINNDDYGLVGNPVRVPVANLYNVPAGAKWDCLRAVGTSVYRLKQGLDATQVWLGLNTQDVGAGLFVGDKLTLELVSVISAPVGGKFAMYWADTWGNPTYQLNSAPGACFKNQYPGGISRGVHVHQWWAFSTTGTYTLRFKVTGTLVGGGTKTTGNIDVPFTVN